MKYKVIADDATTFYAFDIILERWKAEPKMFPYDQPGALIPQTLIPKRLRDDKEALFNFYFYICLYMRGGIESAQAFRAMIRLWEDRPELFDPFFAQYLTKAELQPIIAEYIGWDSHAVSRYWIENSKRLMRNWDGKASNIFMGLSDYEEALRRIRNKRTKKELREANLVDDRGEGFMGFQPKMVSMFIYFIDWEGLLKNSFTYPTPADFHNFRFGLAIRGLRIHPEPASIRTSEQLSKVWRDLTVRYLEARKGLVTPVELADAIWLFSLELCGNSPLTVYHEKVDRNGSGMFGNEDLEHESTPNFLSPSYRQRLQKTCLSCPLIDMCEIAVPASPYYQLRKGRKEDFGGRLYITERFPIQHYLPTNKIKYLPSKTVSSTGKQLNLFDQ